MFRTNAITHNLKHSYKIKTIPAIPKNHSRIKKIPLDLPKSSWNQRNPSGISKIHSRTLPNKSPPQKHKSWKFQKYPKTSKTHLKQFQQNPNNSQQIKKQISKREPGCVPTERQGVANVILASKLKFFRYRISNNFLVCFSMPFGT